MQRFSTWARWIATAILAVVGAIFTGVVFPVVVHFIQEQPQDTPNVALKFLHVALKFLLDLSEQTWLRVTALLLGGFVAGLWLDWLLRRVDRSRAEERKALGTEMVNRLGDLKYPMSQTRPQIMSCFTAARKLGIWAPDQRAFATHPVRAKNLITDYLMHVGTMLRDGHFREAKQHAKNSKAAFASAYVDFGLYRT